MQNCMGGLDASSVNVSEKLSEEIEVEDDILTRPDPTGVANMYVRPVDAQLNCTSVQ